jgi:hypothetical protein
MIFLGFLTMVVTSRQYKGLCWKLPILWGEFHMHNVLKVSFIVLRFLVGRPGDFRRNVCIFNASGNDLGRSPVSHFKYTVSRPAVTTVVSTNIQNL